MPDPATLAISASTGSYACAVRDADGAVHVAVEPRAGVARAAERACAAAGVTAAVIERLVLDVGPGSYTGLRVAVAFAATLRTFAAVSVVVATSLELRALAGWQTLRLPDDRVVRPVLDARRGRWHHAAVGWRDDHVELVDQPAATPLAELADRIGVTEVLLLDQPPPPELAELVDRRGCALHVLPPDPATLARLLLDQCLQPRSAAGPLEPLYLMGSYAEPA